MRIRTIMTAICLSAFAILSAQTTVTAPEAPFSFEPLQMHSFPARDYPITRYGAKKGNVKANTQAFACAMAACHKTGRNQDGWRLNTPSSDIVPTFETAITRIKGITVRNINVRQADAIYEINGDERQPIEDVTLENIHVEEISQFKSQATAVRNLDVRNVTYDRLTSSQRQVNVPGIAPGK